MTERLTVSGATTQRDIDRLMELSNDNQFGRNEAYYKLQRYEDLEEQGRLITLPCKIGDTVWDIKWWDDTTETRVIDGKTYFRRVMKHKVTKSKFKLFDYDNFGKTVFLTREEAEAALKGAENAVR